MRDNVSYSRRALVGCAVGLPLSWLASCGGGGGADPGPGRTSAATNKTALALEPEPLVQPTARRARALARKGVTALALSADGTVGVAQSNGAVRLLTLSSNGVDLLHTLVPPGNAPATDLVFSGDGQTLVSVGRDSTVQGWSVATGERLFTLQGHEHSLRAIAMTPDGQRIVTAGEGTRILVWNANNARLVGALSGHRDFINVLSFSNDGTWLASGDADARILLWRVSGLRSSTALLGHAGELNALAFAPDDGLLASAGEDAKVILWNPASAQQVASLEGHQAPVRTLAFNRNGRVLAAGTDDGSLVVWRKVNRDVVQLDLFPGGAINVLRFDPRDSNRIIAGSEDGQLRVASVAANAGS